MEANLKNPWPRLRLAAEWSLGFALVGFNLSDVQIMWAGHPDLEKYNGRFFGDVARDMGCSIRRAYLKVSDLSQGKATCLLHKYSGDADFEGPLRKILAHPLNTFMTDALVFSRGVGNPAAYGAFPKILGKYARDLKLFSLEDAVAGMTGRSADRFGLKDRGRLAPDYKADLCLFDYQNIRDNTTPTDTQARPSGIEHVFINGVEAVSNGAYVPGRRPGRVLRRS